MTLGRAPAPNNLRMAMDALIRGNYTLAVRHLAQALAANPVDHAALAMMGEVHLAQKNLLESVVYYTRAINACPSARGYKARFVGLASNCAVNSYRAEFGEALVSCFRTPELDCTKVASFWLSLLFAEPRFHAAFGLANRRSFSPSNAACFESLAEFRPLDTPLFLDGVKNVVAYNPLFEEFVTHVRRHLLSDLAAHGKIRKEAFIRIACALSHYAFATDYILDVTDHERTEMDKLRRGIETGEAARDAVKIALIACYGPLHTLSNAKRVYARFESADSLGDVVKRQIRDHDALREAARDIASAGDLADGDSALVREQYENYPYPRWKPFAKETLLSQWRASENSQKAEGHLAGKPIRVLVAGCGTGQEAAIVAAIFPKARVTAVDLSRTSLAYAKLRAKEMDLHNIEFLQADILELETLPGDYDYISSVGVLHHLENPLAGWKILCRILKRGGLMRIGLYSELGRRAIAAAQSAIRREGSGADYQGMLRFRRESKTLLAPNILEDLASRADYYYLSMYRDLLFPAKEHRFSARQIKDILSELGLVFMGFYLAPDVMARYRCRFPDDASQSNLDKWHEFEQANPATFDGMYIFWCREGDGETPS